MMYTRSLRAAVGAAAFALIAAACGSDDAAEQVQDLVDAVADATDESTDDPLDEPAGDDAGDEPADEAPTGAAETVDLGGLTADPADAVVYHSGFEFQLTGLEVIDLDEGAETRVQGFELLADLDIFNATSNAGAPLRTAVYLLWDEPDSDNVVSLRGELDVREIPSHASSSAELTVRIPPADAELLDVDSAALVFGELGRSAAVLPLGSERELVTRLPVEQPSIDGTVLDLGDGLEITITNATIYFDTSDGGHLPDDEVLLELTYDIDNAVDSQTCSTRGTGAWALEGAQGSYVDLGVSERCVRGEQVETDVLTGFRMDADYAGEYTLTHERDGGGDDYEGSVTITIEQSDGSTHAERN